MKKLKIPLIILSTALLFIPTIASKAGYLILSDVVSSSGCEAHSDRYLLGFSLAQPVIGVSSSSDYIESAGFWHWGILPGPSVGIKGEPAVELSLPTEYSLSQNYPNPFNPVTSIPYSLPEAVHVRLHVYNLLGQRVRTLVDGPQRAGYQTVQWNGRDDQGRKLSGGVYFYRLEAGEYSSSRKLLLLK